MKPQQIKPASMLLLPPAKDACPVCSRKHAPDDPHDAQSLYYSQRFYGLRGRWPTWSDALAHCTEENKAYWREALIACHAWTEHPDPIADPPGESVNQIVDMSTHEQDNEQDNQS